MTWRVIELVDVEIVRSARVLPDDVVGAPRVEEIDDVAPTEGIDELRGVIQRIAGLGLSRAEPGKVHVTARYLILN